MPITLLSDELLHELLPRFSCPITRTSLRLLTADQLASLNSEIAQGLISTRSGGQWDMPVDMILTDASGQFMYPVINQIFCFLDDYTLLRPAEGLVVADETNVKVLQKGVRDFYDSVGWDSDADNYVDANLYEDTRPIVADYVARSHKRVSKYLSADGGTFLLDAASGPVQYPDYMAYHANFRWRICLDFSVLALRQAQKNLGKKGVYILADMTHLPFAAGSMDAVVSLHTIYHIPAALQKSAFLEIHRVLAPGKSAVVVYGWGNGSSIKRLGILHKQFSWAYKMVLQRLRPQQQAAASVADFYVFFHDWAWFENQKWPFKLKLFQWRTLDPEVTKIWVRPFLLGKQILAWLADIEDKHPEDLALSGAFPAFVIEKPLESRISE